MLKLVAARKHHPDRWLRQRKHSLTAAKRQFEAMSVINAKTKRVKRAQFNAKKLSVMAAEPVAAEPVAAAPVSDADSDTSSASFFGGFAKSGSSSG